jgi:hypothetical protein
MFPQTTDLPNETVINNETATMGKSYIFDFTTGDFIINDGRLVVSDDVTAIKVWIEKILRTEKGRFAVYEGLNYGTSLEDLIIGTNYSISFVESELKREIEEALFQHPHISSISGLTLTRDEAGITAEFTVVLKDGTAIDSEVNLNVG